MTSQYPPNFFDPHLPILQNYAYAIASLKWSGMTESHYSTSDLIHKIVLSLFHRRVTYLVKGQRHCSAQCTIEFIVANPRQIKKLRAINPNILTIVPPQGCYESEQQFISLYANAIATQLQVWFPHIKVDLTPEETTEAEKEAPKYILQPYPSTTYGWPWPHIGFPENWATLRKTLVAKTRK